ncbi:MAG: hypothetical protein ACUVX9_18125 [Anaerolineae bacterium]
MKTRCLVKGCLLAMVCLSLACDTPATPAPTPHLLARPLEPNLVRNGSFGEGLAGWQMLVDKDTAAVLAHDQTGFVTVTIPTGSAPQDAGWSANVPVAGGASYVASWRVHTEGLTGYASLRLRCFDVEGNLLAEQAGPPALGDTPWTSRAFRLLMPAATVRVEVLPSVKDAVGGRAAFDDVALSLDSGPRIRALIVDMQQEAGLIRPLNQIDGSIGADAALALGASAVALPAGGDADWRAIFPHAWANPEDPSAYDWRATDVAVAGAVAAGQDVLFRLGGVAEGQERLAPPSPDRFAAIVRHIVMHYNQGWAGGYHYGIARWELWPAPDGADGPMDVRLYAELVATAAAELRALDPDLEVGAPGLDSLAHLEYLRAVLEGLVQRNTRLGFLSWHDGYHGAPASAGLTAHLMQAAAQGGGQAGVPLLISRWGPPRRDVAGDPADAAWLVSAVAYAQDTPLMRAYLAWPRTTLVDASGALTCAGQAFAWLGRLQQCPRRLVTHGADELGFSLLAGMSGDRRRVYILVADTGSATEEYRLGLGRFPPGYTFTVSEISAEHAGKIIAQGRESQLPEGVLILPWQAPAVHLVEIRWDGTS